MSQEKLEQALKNWQEKISHYELDLSITSSEEKKFELQKKIEESRQKAQELEQAIQLLESIDSYVNIDDNQPPENILGQLLTDSLQRLPSVFDKYDNLIEFFFEQVDFENLELQESLDYSLTAAIRIISRSKLAYIAEFINGNFKIVCESKSENLPSGFNGEALQIFLVQECPNLLELDTARQFNIANKNDSDKMAKCLFIPVNNLEQKSLFIIYDFDISFEYSEDIFSLILNSLYQATDCFRFSQSEKTLRAAIYDDIKCIYKFVSDSMYERRFQDFCDSLNNIEMFFEPIVFFDKSYQNLAVWGWEALARDRDLGKVPANLFKVAELWGVRFKTELDLTLIRRAIETYNEALKQEKMFRYDEIKPLSINVYPETLFRSAYRQLLKELLKEEKHVPGKKIIFEVSEKNLIISGEGNDETGSLDSFHQLAKDLSNSFDIQFAIDDFGVGNSSISRLSRFKPTYVKVDRDILLYEHDLGKRTIENLVTLESNFGKPALTVIVEGFDNQSKISLDELVNKIGVEYVQGYSLGMAAPKLEKRFSKDKYENIFGLLNWQDRSKS